jgi:hypothetical protein
MSRTFVDYLSRRPVQYGRDVIRGLGITAPPVSEYEVADFLGYTIKEVDDEDFAERPEMRETFQTACAHLFPYENIILIYGELPPLRKRTCGFHELGHAILPWHSRLNFACAAYTLGLDSHKRFERQAFLCGAELQMPHHLFAADAAALPLGMAAIRTLARRYVASLETTAIRYVQTHLYRCALVVLEASRGRPLRRRTPGNDLWHESTLPFTTLPMLSSVGEEDIAPLRVKYSIKAPRFPHYIPARRGIPEGNPIFEAWNTGISLTKELPARMFGLQTEAVYHAEICPLGNPERVMVLLWLPDPQLVLAPGWEVLL